MKKKPLVLIVLSALFAALIMVVTAYVLHIPTGLNEGYIHLGDTMIYIAASMLPLPYAMAAAAVGGALADILSGSLLWAPFTAKNDRLLCRRNYIATGIAGVIGIAGYFVAACLLYTPASAVVEILPNLIQEAAGGVMYVLLALAMDRAKLKSRLQAL